MIKKKIKVTYSRQYLPLQYLNFFSPVEIICSIDSCRSIGRKTVVELLADHKVVAVM